MDLRDFKQQIKPYKAILGFDFGTKRFGVADAYMTTADFADYARAQRVVSETYLDQKKFAHMGLVNIANAGIFSSDRSVKKYAEKIRDLD